MRKINGEDKVCLALCGLRNGEGLHCDHEVRDLPWRQLKGNESKADGLKNGAVRCNTKKKKI